MIVLLLTTITFAATPKIYASIGDQVYKSAGAVRTLSSYKTFKQDHKLFFDYAVEAEAARKEGLWLDKYRMLPEAKVRSRAYLELLRRLNQINKQIAKIVKETTLATIKKHHVNTYYAIKKSRHPILKEDPELRRAMKRFEQRLARENKKEKQEKAAKKATYMRSFNNLRGEWKTVKDAEESIHFSFKDKTHLQVTHAKGSRVKTLKGRWKSDPKHIIFDVKKITNRSVDGFPHTRKTSVVLRYTIVSVSTKKMTLFDTRRKKKIELRR